MATTLYNKMHLPVAAATAVAAAGVATLVVFPDKVNERIQAALACWRDGQAGLDLHACVYGDCSRVWNGAVKGSSDHSKTVSDWIQKGRWPGGLETLRMLQAATAAAKNEREQGNTDNFDLGTARRLLECGSLPTAPNRVEGCGSDYFIDPTVEGFFLQLARQGDSRMALLAKDVFLTELPLTIANIRKDVSVTRSVSAGREYAFRIFDALFAAGGAQEVYQIAEQTAKEAFAKAMRRLQEQDLGELAGKLSNTHHLLFAQDAVRLLTRIVVQQGKAPNAAHEVLDQLETARQIWTTNTDVGAPDAYAAELEKLGRMMEDLLGEYHKKLESQSQPVVSTFVPS